MRTGSSFKDWQDFVIAPEPLPSQIAAEAQRCMDNLWQAVASWSEPTQIERGEQGRHRKQ